jgi:hypothetical protein
MTISDFAVYAAAQSENDSVLVLDAERLMPGGRWLAEPMRALLERQIGTLDPLRMGALSYAWWMEESALRLFADSGCREMLHPKHAEFLAKELGELRSQIEKQVTPANALDMLGVGMRLLALEVWAVARQGSAESRISHQVLSMAKRLESVKVPPNGKLNLLPETAIRMAVEHADLYDLDLVAFEKDAGASARPLDRPSLERALAMLDSRDAEVHLVAKLDRLTRSIRDLGDLIETYFGASSKLALLSVGENIDTRSAAGRFWNVLASVSQCRCGGRGYGSFRSLSGGRRGSRCGCFFIFGASLHEPDDAQIEVHEWPRRSIELFSQSVTHLAHSAASAAVSAAVLVFAGSTAGGGASQTAAASHAPMQSKSSPRCLRSHLAMHRSHSVSFRGATYRGESLRGRYLGSSR